MAPQLRACISADTALRLGRFFENAPEFWIDLQNHYDLTLAATEAGDEIDRAITVLEFPRLA